MREPWTAALQRAGNPARRAAKHYLAELELEELEDCSFRFLGASLLLLELLLAPGLMLTLPLTLPPSRLTVVLLLELSGRVATRERSSTVVLLLELAVPGARSTVVELELDEPGARSTVVELELDEPGAGTTVVLLELAPGAGTLRSSTTVRSQPTIESAIAVAPAIRTNFCFNMTTSYLVYQFEWTSPSRACSRFFASPSSRAIDAVLLQRFEGFRDQLGLVIP